MVTSKKTTTKKTISKKKAVKKTLKGQEIVSPKYQKLAEEMNQIKNYVSKAWYITEKRGKMATVVYIKDPVSLGWFIGGLASKRDELINISENNVVNSLVDTLYYAGINGEYDSVEIKFSTSRKGKPFKTIKF